MRKGNTRALIGYVSSHGKPYSLNFVINDLPKMANPSGSRSTHWRYAQQEVQKWHGLVALAVGKFKPPKPLEKARLSLTRHSSRSPDYDGLVRGFKSVVDGLCRHGVLQDDNLKTTGSWICNWFYAPINSGRIQVDVVEDFSSQEEK